MKVIDLKLFNKQPYCEFATRDGKEYKVTFVSGVSEIYLMQEQARLSEVIGKWSTVKIEEIDKWKQILKGILREQKDITFNNDDEKEIDKLYPLDLITILMKISSYLNDRAEIIYELFPDDTKKEVKKISEELKKKAMNTASSKSEA